MTGFCKKKLALAVVVALVLPSALAMALLKEEGFDGPSIPLHQGRPVIVGEAVSRQELIQLRLPGVTRAVERSDLAFLHSGHLAERRVGHGQQVERDEILAVLHNPALMPGVTTAEAKVREIDEQLAQIERDVLRLENLLRFDMISANEVESITSRRNALRETRFQAETRLNEAREQLGEASIRAPYKGTVINLHAEVGQFVAAGRPIISVVGSNGLEIELNLPAHRASALVIGDIVMLRQVDTGLNATGTIREIGPASVGRPATIIVGIDDAGTGQWLPGIGVEAEFSWQGPHLLMVPLSSIIDPGTGVSRVFRIVEGKAELVSVQTGRLIGGKVTVEPAVEGQLKAGDKVVIAGQTQLLDGESIRVLQ